VTNLTNNLLRSGIAADFPYPGRRVACYGGMELMEFVNIRKIRQVVTAESAAACRWFVLVAVHHEVLAGGVNADAELIGIGGNEPSKSTRMDEVDCLEVVGCFRDDGRVLGVILAAHVDDLGIGTRVRVGMTEGEFVGALSNQLGSLRIRRR